MDGHITCQGRVIGQSELCWLRDVVCEHPDWSRHKITKHICRHWDWRTNSGQLKTFAARSIIDKLEQRGHLNLPPIHIACRRRPRPPFPKGFVAPKINHIEEHLNNLTPLSIHIPMPNSNEDGCVGYYLNRYHCLGFNRTIGENLKFLIRDRSGRDIACLLFGSAAQKTSEKEKRQNLLVRLGDHELSVLAFLHDISVPFTNNLAEQDIRMIKVRLKISGCFRTLQGAKQFARIRSYLSTARKQGRNILNAITAAINGQPFLPVTTR